MTEFNPSINLGPIGVTVSDISILFKAVAQLFVTQKDPDDGVCQEEVLLENEASRDGIWRSVSHVRLRHTIKEGLRVLYNYNSEALGRKRSFVNYEHVVHFTRLPELCDSTLFLLARSALCNKSDHCLENKNAVGFIALFDPPIPAGRSFEYRYEQRYSAIIPLWGEPAEEIKKDYRFVRETKSFTRIFAFPRERYARLEPVFFLMDKEKKNKIPAARKIHFSITEEENVVRWVFSLDSPPRDSVFRVRWERPE
jgi:hypothetical protein